MTPARSWAALAARAVVVVAVAAGLSAALRHFRPRPARADLILTGGTIYTGAGDGAPVRALAVRGGRLLAVGGDAAVLRHRGGATPLVDLKGAVVVPGFADAHVHLLGVGEAIANEATGGSLYLDLSGTESEEDAVQRVRARARGLAPGQWIVGTGWNQENWTTRRLPDRRLLSDIVAYNPVFLVRADAHTVWVNGRALDLAGLSSRTPDPSGGRIVRDPRSNEPSGLLLDRAWEPVYRLLPRLPADEKAALILRALQAFAALGVTSVTSMGSLNHFGLIDLAAPGDEEADLFRSLAASGRLPIRVALFLPGPSEAAEALLRRGPETGLGDGRLDIRGVKLFADGAMGSRGAAMLQPYADDPSAAGVLRMDQKEIAAWAARGMRRGVAVAVHAIGDAAVRAAARAFAETLALSPGADPRFRIEHLSLFDPADLDPLARARVIASVQPRFLAPGPEGPMEARRVGEERAARVHAWGTLLGAGLPLAGGSDSYDRPVSPILGFYAAVTRRAAPHPAAAAGPGTPAEAGEGWHPGERLGRVEALRMFTSGAAYAAGRDADTGSLEPGKWADFVILSADILTIPEEEIPRTEVVATYVAGNEVYRRRDSSP